MICKIPKSFWKKCNFHIWYMYIIEPYVLPVLGTIPLWEIQCTCIMNGDRIIWGCFFSSEFHRIPKHANEVLRNIINQLKNILDLFKFCITPWITCINGKFLKNNSLSSFALGCTIYKNTRVGIMHTVNNKLALTPPSSQTTSKMYDPLPVL